MSSFRRAVENVLAVMLWIPFVPLSLVHRLGESGRLGDRAASAGPWNVDRRSLTSAPADGDAARSAPGDAASRFACRAWGGVRSVLHALDRSSRAGDTGTPQFANCTCSSSSCPRCGPISCTMRSTISARISCPCASRSSM